MQSRNPDMVTILATAPPPQALLVDDRPDSAMYSATRVCGLSWIFAVADCHFFPLSLFGASFLWLSQSPLLIILNSFMKDISYCDCLLG